MTVSRARNGVTKLFQWRGCKEGAGKEEKTKNKDTVRHAQLAGRNGMEKSGEREDKKKRAAFSERIRDCNNEQGLKETGSQLSAYQGCPSFLAQGGSWGK